MKTIAPGIYQNGGPGFYIRPGNRSWLKLDATNLEEAKEEALRRKNPPPEPDTMNILELVQAYQEAGCPTPNLTVRDRDYTAKPLARALGYFGTRKADSLRIADCLKYREWRQATSDRETVNRAVEIELAALSACLNWAVAMGHISANPIRSGRPRFCVNVVHCRDKAFKDATELHGIASRLLQKPQSAVLGWQMLLEAFTGLRTNEALALRMDAEEGKPGSIKGNCLFVERSKRGLNPFVLIHPDLAEMIRAHHEWHSGRSPWWFPSSDGVNPVSHTALTKALGRLAPGRTSHGLRSFYVTVRRSQKASDAQIAAEIGDRTVSLISQTYGDCPPNWFDGKDLRWVPESGPAWVKQQAEGEQ